MAWKRLPNNPDDTKMSLGEHLEELRTRIIRALLGLIVAMGVTIWFGTDIIEILRYPFDQVLKEYPEIAGEIVVRKAPEAFMMYFRVSLLAGLVLASPWIFYQMWQFIAAGLYPNERKYVNWGVPFSAGLFIFGAFFFLRFIAKPMMTFFMVFGHRYVGGVVPRFDLREHIALMTTMMVVFGLAFQMPIVIFILGKMGLVTVKQLKKYRRYVIVIILIVAALATSPSPVDQVGLAVPMWLLYELGILLVHFFCKPKGTEEAQGDEQAPTTALATTGGGDADADAGTAATQPAPADDAAGETDYDQGYGEDYEDYYNDENYDDEDYGYEEDDGGEEDDEADDGRWNESGFADDEPAATDQAPPDDEQAGLFEEESGYSWSPTPQPDEAEQAPTGDEPEDEPGDEVDDDELADDEPDGDPADERGGNAESDGSPEGDDNDKHDDES